MKRSSTSQSTVIVRAAKAPKTKAKAKPRKAKLRPTLSRARFLTGFPDQLTMTHRYCESGVSVTSTLGVMGHYLFRANGMFDPNATGSGHQPLYFDQLTAIYNHWHVIGSRIKVVGITADSNTATFSWALWQNDDTSTTPSDIFAVAEQSKGVLKMQPAQVTATPQFATLGWSAKKTFGGSTLADSELQGTVAADPTEQSFFQITVQTHGGVTAAMLFNVEIEYIAVWTEVKDISSS